MCSFNGSAVELYSAGYLAWLAGPLLYFAVAIFGIIQLVIHCCNADKVIRHYVVMLSLFVVSLVLRGAWFMLTCPTPKSVNGTDIETYYKAADEAGWRIDDYDDAMIQLMGGTEFTAYQAGIKVGFHAAHLPRDSARASGHGPQLILASVSFLLVPHPAR